MVLESDSDFGFGLFTFASVLILDLIVVLMVSGCMLGGYMGFMVDGLGVVGLGV